MNRYSSQKGFTLLELLVVISIIGLLASVVLASLNTARSRGSDAALKSQAAQFRNLYALEITDTGSYTALKGGWRPSAASCTFSGTYAAQAQAICENLVETAAGCGSGLGCVYIGATTPNAANTFTIMVVLPGATASAGGTAQYLCFGSSGRTSIGPSNPGGGNWSGAGCYANP